MYISFIWKKSFILKNRKIIKESFNFIYLRGTVLWCPEISHIVYICSLSTIIILHTTELFLCSVHLTQIHLYSQGEGSQRHSHKWSSSTYFFYIFTTLASNLFQGWEQGEGNACNLCSLYTKLIISYPILYYKKHFLLSFRGSIIFHMKSKYFTSKC